MSMATTLPTLPLPNKLYLLQSSCLIKSKPVKQEVSRMLILPLKLVFSDSATQAPDLDYLNWFSGRKINKSWKSVLKFLKIIIIPSSAAASAAAAYVTSSSISVFVDRFWLFPQFLHFLHFQLCHAWETQPCEEAWRLIRRTGAWQWIRRRWVCVVNRWLLLLLHEEVRVSVLFAFVRTKLLSHRTLNVWGSITFLSPNSTEAKQLNPNT